MSGRGAARRPGRTLCAAFWTASGGVAVESLPEDLPTDYYGRNLQNAQADIQCAYIKTAASLWTGAPTYDSSGWDDCGPCGSTINGTPAPRHGIETLALPDLLDAGGLPVAGIVHAVGGAGLGADFMGSVGTAAKDNLVARLADFGSDIELAWLVIQLGLPDMSSATHGPAFGANLATLEAQVRALNITGASTFQMLVFEAHSQIGVGETYRPDVVAGTESWAAGNPALRSIVRMTGRDIRGASYTVPIPSGSHWESDGTQVLSRAVGGQMYRSRFIPRWNIAA